MLKRFGAAGLAIAGLALLGWVLTQAPKEDARPTGIRAERTFRITSANRQVHPGDVPELMDASDRVVQEIRSRGIEDAGSYVQGRLGLVEVSEADRREFFEANRWVFGDRRYEESWEAVDELLRIHRLRIELGVDPSDKGLVYLDSASGG